MQKSRVLIVIIASNTKKTGGDANYNHEQSILAHVPSAYADRLMRGRNSVLRWILRGAVTRDGVRLLGLPANRTLVSGPEFGGASTEGLYLPAAERFQGRLFGRLDPGAAELLQSTMHHVLILSGLYGLVMPSEPVQNYQCYVEDLPSVRKLWTVDDLLTNVLLAYVKQHRVTHVFDLTAQNSYRFLIAWERVRAETQRVLHCYGTQAVGSGFLIPLGVVARHLLSEATEAELLGIQPGSSSETPYERVHFQPLARPPAGAPHEVERQRAELNTADELGRMRRCFTRIMDAIDTQAGQGAEEGVVRRIKRLVAMRCIPSNVGDYMIHVTRRRNDIEYRPHCRFTETELRAVRAEFAQVRKWAQGRGLAIPAECLQI